MWKLLECPAASEWDSYASIEPDLPQAPSWKPDNVPSEPSETAPQLSLSAAAEADHEQAGQRKLSVSPPSTAIDLRQASGSEISGDLKPLYEHWLNESVNSQHTIAVERYLLDTFDKLDIRPRAQDVSCRRTLCRVRFAFENIEQIFSMARMPRNSDFDVRVGKPEVTSSGASIVAYFAPGRLPLSPEDEDEPTR
ncbi:MAG: hypothetical protein JXM73_18875 [Anaerolineae bacterium]|nr:hypothetical protein [Anaerolineae bacterium]